MSDEPEPEGTRLPIVQFFSVLTFNYLAPLLPPRYVDGNANRKEFVVIWPKWCSSPAGWHWRMLYLFDSHEPCFAIWLWPDGKASLHFYKDCGTAIHTDTVILNAGIATTLPEKLENYLNDLVERYGLPIVEHMNAQSVLPRSPAASEIDPDTAHL